MMTAAATGLAVYADWAGRSPSRLRETVSVCVWRRLPATIQLCYFPAKYRSPSPWRQALAEMTTSCSKSWLRSPVTASDPGYPAPSVTHLWTSVVSCHGTDIQRTTFPATGAYSVEGTDSASTLERATDSAISSGRSLTSRTPTTATTPTTNYSHFHYCPHCHLPEISAVDSSGAPSRWTLSSRRHGV